MNAQTPTIKRERGAALVIVMFALLIMSVIGLSISYTAGQEVFSSKNELLANQAFYAAEAGLQDALNVIRGQRCPIGAASCNPSLASNKVSFTIVSTPSSSNAASDTSAVARLSRWLSYSALGGTAVTLDATNGLYYRIQVLPIAGSPDLQLVSTGLGPLGARRTVRLRIVRNAAAVPPLPATITMLGQNPTGTTGNSNAHTTSGYDHAATASRDPNWGGNKPIFGVLDAPGSNANRDYLLANSVSGDKPGTFEIPPGVPDRVVSLPTAQIPFNNDPAQARAFIRQMSSIANTVINPGDALPSGALGTSARQTVVVVNGNFTPPSGGAGILIVTGDLTLNGNFNYEGLIFVLGTGRVLRNGGGGGTINGGMLLASFTDASTIFDGTPVFDTNGGGNSNVLYNSGAIQNVLNSIPITARSFTVDSTDN